MDPTPAWKNSVCHLYRTQRSFQIMLLSVLQMCKSYAAYRVDKSRHPDRQSVQDRHQASSLGRECVSGSRYYIVICSQYVILVLHLIDNKLFNDTYPVLHQFSPLISYRYYVLYITVLFIVRNIFKISACKKCLLYVFFCLILCFIGI